MRQLNTMAAPAAAFAVGSSAGGGWVGKGGGAGGEREANGAAMAAEGECRELASVSGPVEGAALTKLAATPVS